MVEYPNLATRELPHGLATRPRDNCSSTEIRSAEDIRKVATKDVVRDAISLPTTLILLTKSASHGWPHAAAAVEDVFIFRGLGVLSFQAVMSAKLVASWAV